jgi:hypothetical protein
MSMGFLLPRPKDGEDEADTPVVWRGLMVQKAVQQLLFDVDWRESAGAGAGSGTLLLVSRRSYMMLTYVQCLEQAWMSSFSTCLLVRVMCRSPWASSCTFMVRRLSSIS